MLITGNVSSQSVDRLQDFFPDLLSITYSMHITGLPINHTLFVCMSVVDLKNPQNLNG